MWLDEVENVRGGHSFAGIQFKQVGYSVFEQLRVLGGLLLAF